jgi:tetratricopeptide (TPR) repeat protein
VSAEAKANRSRILTFSVLVTLLVILVFPSASAFSEPRDTVVAQKVVDDWYERVAADSLNAEFRYELANALHDSGKKHEALLHYDKAVSIKSDYLEAMVNRGAVLNELGRIDDAMASFEQALSVNPRDPRALLNLGNSLYALKRYDDALTRYHQALDSDSTFAEGHYYIGIAFADAGIYREAIREWRKVIKIAPNSELARNAKDNMEVLMVFLRGK